MVEEETKMIMAALSTLTPTQFRVLTHSILNLSRHHLHRLSSILSSPSLFSLTLHHLLSLSLSSKTLLIAHHLLSLLRLFLLHFHPPDSPRYLSSRSPPVKLRDLDAVLLLLFICRTHQHSPEILLAGDPSEWRESLSKLFSNAMLGNLSQIGGYDGAVLIPYVEMVSRCSRFVRMMGSCGGGRKEGREVAASPATVVGLPAVEVSGGGVGVEYCAVCKEEMREGREVCELPCEHLFHWKCILPWLKKRNTCPCCRFRLPTDDVFAEIERLWEVLITASGGSFDGEYCWRRL